jgi:signal transduction histidine kinase
MLNEAGFDSIPATSGIEALKLAESEVPDLILLDIQMPELDGFEVCERLKKIPTLKDIPVIFLTARKETDDIVRGLEIGAVDYVTKPFKRGELLTRVRTHLQLKHSSDTILKQNKRLHELNEEKNDFLGIVSHDLKNPINGIIGLGRILLDYPEDIDDAERAHIIEEVIASANRMQRLVSDLLNVARLEQGKLAISRTDVDLLSVIEMVAKTYQRSAANKNITLSIEKNGSMFAAYADIDICMQIFENLVSNAIKYSPFDTTITLRTIHNNETIRIEIQDEGPGISEEDQQKLFLKFSKLSAQPTGGEDSTGLGLAIVKRFVDYLEGNVWCDSTLGQGTTFIVELPTSPST